jgi:hypothetical protein
MESLWWALKTRDSFFFSWPLVTGAFFLFLFAQSDFVVLLTLWYWRLFANRPGRREPSGREPLPSGLAIIPSLLRDREDLDAIALTIDACGQNGYPSELAIVASVDGRTERPELYRELCEWVESRRYPSNVRVYVGGTPTRLGKMMAVEAGVRLMKSLVARGLREAFPPIYFSMDGDGTLGPRALELLARRLTLPHRLSKNPRRVVSGKICIRPELFWKGWTRASLRSFFSVTGQIYLQVAREFLFSNVTRFNLKLKPQIGIPGALYCCWSEILLNGPRFMGFMKGLRLRDWTRWWLGLGRPAFSLSRSEPLPEAMTGASDDTAISFMAAMSSWRDGALSMDAPRTPLHALGRLLRAYFWERSPDYEPEARVYTFTPTTLKALWVQRVRWNASRLECGYRFKSAFAFHWEVGGIVAWHAWTILWNVSLVAFFYLALPLRLLATTDGLTAYAISYTLQVFTFSLYTLLALAIEKEWRKFWPVVFALPLAPLYTVGINFMACTTGVVKDLFLFGNTTKFAPEWTLKKGRTERIALLFRMRRFLSLCVRAVVVGDVPWGAFWLGWTETPWTPSGYDGWTTGTKPRSIIPRRGAWFGRSRP